VERIKRGGGNGGEPAFGPPEGKCLPSLCRASIERAGWRTAAGTVVGFRQLVTNYLPTWSGPGYGAKYIEVTDFQ
jgi:hypothetical protein